MLISLQSDSLFSQRLSTWAWADGQRGGGAGLLGRTAGLLRRGFPQEAAAVTAPWAGFRPVLAAACTPPSNHLNQEHGCTLQLAA